MIIRFNTNNRLLLQINTAIEKNYSLFIHLDDKPDALAPPTPPPASPLSDRNDHETHARRFVVFIV